MTIANLTHSNPNQYILAAGPAKATSAHAEAGGIQKIYETNLTNYDLVNHKLT
jgi:hypothetical protein